MITRAISKSIAKSHRSVLLLGPRQTGKSTLMRSLKPDVEINLAHPQTFLEFSRNPAALEEILVAEKPLLVFLDEVQRLPSLLNTLQVVLDEPKNKCRFLLTGSSARKLRRGGANLLPGRIHSYTLGCLTAAELGYKMDQTQALETGTLPGIYCEPDRRDRRKTLRSYASTYLKEEIQAEALTRNLEGFSRFLMIAAEQAGMFLDLSKLASEAQIPRQSAVRYFEILQDTLIVKECSRFAKSSRRRLVQHPRFFFFDPGVLNGTLETFSTRGARSGILFEHLIYNQFTDSAISHDDPIRISSYRTEHGAEVDFIVEYQGRVWAIEAKASINVGTHDMRGLKSFAEFYDKPHRAVVAYLGTHRRKIRGIDVLPWQRLLKEMGL